VHGLRATILRYANVYGPRQDPLSEAGVVAIFTKRMLENREIYIFGDGEQSRDFVYVTDVADANFRCTSRDFDFAIYNVGTQRATSINELFRILCRLTGYKEEPIYVPPRKGELFKSYLNISKIKRELNWNPRIDLKEGLKKTVDFFKDEKLLKRNQTFSIRLSAFVY
jgi:UDP-glucose 4-epimerase